MIRVLHNGFEKTINPSAHENLGEAIDACVRSAADPPDVVLQVRVNGCTVPEESFGKLQSFPLEGVAEIEIQSGNPVDVARSCLANCQEYSLRVRESLGQTAELMRQGRIEEANGLYSEVLDALSIFVNAIAAAKEALGEPGKVLGGLERDLAPWFSELVQAQERADWVRVADYLEYELDPILARWASQISEVREACAGGPEVDHEQ